jgi:hypothetical protein
MKHLKLTKAFIGLTLTTTAMFAGGQCFNVYNDGSCGGTAQQVACSGCLAINYSPTAALDCGGTPGENGCGMSVCNYNQVTEWEIKDQFTPIIVNGSCFGCGEPDTLNPPINDGCCEQDSLGGSQCGDCYD